MNAKKRGLGRGLDVLLSSVSTSVSEDVLAGESLRDLPVGALSAGKHQPRRHFDEDALSALTDSIRAQGVVQPIIVRATGNNRYEIIAGERRWRAAQRAGLKTISAVVRQFDERTAMAVALVENIQRADLNPLEEAEALHKLIQECGLTHDKCAEAVGKSRAAVSNLLRLTELNADVQDLLRRNQLSFGHAKVLLGVVGGRQSALAQRVVAEQLSVRQTEALVQGQVAPPRPPKPVADAHPLQARFHQRFGLPVTLEQNAKGRGKLVVNFKNQAELDRLLQSLS